MSFLKTLMPLLSLKRLAQRPVAPSGNVKIWIDIPLSGWTRSPKNSVPDGKFDKLEIDSEVCFVEKAGEKGPQAYIFKGCNGYNRSNQNIRQGAQEEPALFRGT
ncbi:MAG: hypothetical protein BA867_11270 [Desulfobacterales bacterium S5133MH16]|nr:MAG: hypothetical protein BA867_11270 [Desulfobacterales bacterium S5133MH16]